MPLETIPSLLRVGAPGLRLIHSLASCHAPIRRLIPNYNPAKSKEGFHRRWPLWRITLLFLLAVFIFIFAKRNCICKGKMRS